MSYKGWFLFLFSGFLFSQIQGSQNDQFSSFVEYDQTDEELLKASQSVYDLFTAINHYTREEQFDLIFTIGDWIDQNDFDSAAFALITLNEKLETEKYDSIINPAVNYQIGQLYMNTGQFAKAEEKITESVAGSHILKDSLFLMHSYLMLANISLKLKHPEDVNRYLFKYAIYDRADSLIQRYYVTRMGYELLLEDFEAAAKTAKKVNVDQLQRSFYIGTFLLNSRILAIHEENFELDHLLMDSLNTMNTDGSLLISRIKNSHFNSLRRSNVYQASDYLDIVLKMPDYGITISKEAISNGVVLYSSCLYQSLSQKRRRNKYIIVGCLTLIIVGITSLIIKRNQRIKSLELENEETVSVSGILLSQYNEYFNSIDEILSKNETNAIQKIKFEREQFKRLEKNIKDAEIHSKFLSPQLVNKLTQINQDINVNDIKLASLILLQMDNFEIAHILSISADATRKRKQRLKSKLRVENEEELLSLLLSLK